MAEAGVSTVFVAFADLVGPDDLLARAGLVRS
jgi:hypothetical protein